MTAVSRALYFTLDLRVTERPTSCAANGSRGTRGVGFSSNKLCCQLQTWDFHIPLYNDSLYPFIYIYILFMNKRNYTICTCFYTIWRNVSRYTSTTLKHINVSTHERKIIIWSRFVSVFSISRK